MSSLGSGPFGYPEFLAAFQDPSHEEYERLVEWVGPGFDPGRFVVAEVEARLEDWFGR